MKKLIALLLAAILLLACIGALSENDKEMENYTRYTDYDPQPAEPIGLIPGSDHTTLVVWFSRVGNTVFAPDVDVVSSATLNQDENGELIGNAQLTARWIAEETGADVFPIQTAYTYPSNSNQTVAVGEGQDIDFVSLRLATHLEDINGYDTVYLVAPIWHYTVCTPLRSFLEETDLSGKTIYVFTTHCGSRFADSVKTIQQMQPNATVLQGVAVSGFDPYSSENEVRTFVQSTTK